MPREREQKTKVFQMDGLDCIIVISFSFWYLVCLIFYLVTLIRIYKTITPLMTLVMKTSVLTCQLRWSSGMILA